VIEKTITIFRNKKPKNLKFGLSGFLGFFKKPKKPRFFKSDFYSPAREVMPSIRCFFVFALNKTIIKTPA